MHEWSVRGAIAAGSQMPENRHRGDFGRQERDQHVHHHRVRSPLAAYGIGMAHGIAGSAGIALLLLAGIPSRTEALVALALFASATAVSMAALSSAFGLFLGLDRIRRGFSRLAPGLAGLAFVFGVGCSAVAVGNFL